ncbi:MAG: SRPBCC family protein [Hyphomicrobium sp.]|nr:SRPBCC family protein [Hyphomicrobium sp.]
MKSYLKAAAFAVATLIASSSANAHGPTPQKVDMTVTLPAPPEKVWDAIKDFGNIASWHSGVAKSVGTGSNATGATRILTLKSGGDIDESLDEFDDKGMSYSYRSGKENVEVFPLSSYSATLKVKAKDGGSEVEWRSRLYRADTTNEPPEDRNDAAAVKAMSDFVAAGFEGLKAKFPQK